MFLKLQQYNPNSMISLEGLNPEQRSATECLEGPLLILAGAGSGKTRTITHRIAHMIQHRGVPASQILAITFTNKAASEMKERVRKLLKKKTEAQISTFHALGLLILKEEIHRLGFQKNFTLYDRSDQMSLLREALKHYRGGKAFDKATLIAMMSDLKNKGITASQYVTSPYFDPDNDYSLALEHCYHYLTDKMRFFNAIDFDDILMLVVNIFEKFPEVAQKFSSKYKFVTVDEYQDTNPLQFKMIQGLTSTHNNICVVGDDDQSIYGFRGANIQNILDFERQFPGTKVIKLEQNYRSTSSILDLANKVIKENKKRKEKTMWSDQEEGLNPFLWATADDTHEAQIIVDDINKRRNKGEDLNEMAVLYRSNKQAPVIEDQLRLNQVPYKILGGQKYFEKKEIKDIIAYLSVVQNPYDEISLRRILNVPARGIGPVTLKKYLELAGQNKLSLYQAFSQFAAANNDSKILAFLALISELKITFKEKALSEALPALVSKIDYFEYIEKFYEVTKQIDVRKNSVYQLYETAKRFENQRDIKPTLRNFLERLLLVDNQESKNDDEQLKQITLMTLHSSKGLEFDTVYMVGVEEELLPHKRSIIEDQDLSEERRLCYVGITRAKKHLILSYCKERKFNNKNIPRHISRFLIPHKERLTHQDRTTFEHLSPEEAIAHKKQVFSDMMKFLD
ncbi:MAG: UvrD-helicase domain-containing protein [Halobacteriovoraceae bacterium]|nr:UvrD-helicase domain-containing protein [Halobacteriovoraceae bacterium]MCB9093952.1 UvrD-helicase domain-containing protein [Halobacteriovoraceae bacterium]